MELKTISGDILFVLDGAKTILELVVAAVAAQKSLRGANLYGADLYGANLYGANLYGKKIASLRVFVGLYEYQVWAVLYQDGKRYVHMGCLFYDLEKWEKIGIRKSNLSEFPDDASERCEERVAAFEFAKAAVLRMKLPETALVTK